MKIQPVEVLWGVLAMVVVVGAGARVGLPLVLAERVAPGVRLGPYAVAGVSTADLPGVIREYSRQLQQQTVTVAVEDTSATYLLRTLGVSLDVAATSRALQQRAGRPVVSVDTAVADSAVAEQVGDFLTPPQNATLELTAGTLVLVPAAVGERPDAGVLAVVVAQRITTGRWAEPITLPVVTAEPAVTDTAVVGARQVAEALLREGLTLTYGDETWPLTPFTLRRLLRFEEAAGVLAVTLDPELTAEYLEKTIAPEINQLPQDARFERDETGRVTQFSAAHPGLMLDTTATVAALAAQVATGVGNVVLAVQVTEPAVQTAEDIESFGVTTLLASGESSFAGSPANRIHNIRVGTERYHGLLIPPGAEFSFNEFLGPVDAAHNFKPELVIKQNVTVPEYGGGLCQVSTTLFRAAIYSGLEITARRNHAYAVRYYGKPGFDATIYPPYTDLRFTNNTPSYILIQARVDGSQLAFEFWGTPDDRSVEVVGPHTYDAQLSGAVKATLQQIVRRADGSVLLDETFYSRYQSPDRFPKVVQADDPNRNANTATPTPTPAPSPAAAPPAS